MAGTATMVFEGAIGDGWMGLDIGPRTRQQFAAAIKAAKQAVWNGPMGAFETPPFDAGTRAVADAVVEATEGGAVTIAGGGDTSASLEAAGLAQRLVARLHGRRCKP